MAAHRQAWVTTGSTARSTRDAPFCGDLGSRWQLGPGGQSPWKNTVVGYALALGSVLCCPQFARGLLPTTWDSAHWFYKKKKKPREHFLKSPRPRCWAVLCSVWLEQQPYVDWVQLAGLWCMLFDHIKSSSQSCGGVPLSVPNSRWGDGGYREVKQPEVKREFSYCVVWSSWGPLRLIQGHSEGHGRNQGHPPLPTSVWALCSYMWGFWLIVFV